jgi:hypothetical protein
MDRSRISLFVVPSRRPGSADTPPTTVVLDPRLAIKRDFDWDPRDLKAMLGKCDP